MLKRISEGLDSEVFDLLRQKFPKFGELLYWEHQIRKESGSTTRASKLGVKDVDPKEKRPWKKLPNIRDFSIKVMPYDGVFLLFGLSKRFDPKLVFHPGLNAPVNKYVDYMFKRLAKEVELGLYDKAVTTMWTCMNSKAYLAVSVNAVLQNWHRKIPIGEVNKHLSEVNKLVKLRETKIDYARVYLKEPSKIRPLGVPSIPGRIYLHMYNNLLTQGRLVTESNAQHAYLPGRGVMTAGNALVKLLDKPNIYEADYVGFFENVTHKGLKFILQEELNLPLGEVEWIMKLNKSHVKLPDNVLLNESRAALRSQDGKAKDKSMETGMMSGGNGVIVNLKKLDLKVSKVAVLEKPEELTVVDGLLIKDLRPLRSLGEKKTGVPQGAPTSPNLATVFHRWLEKMVESIFYADDLIVFPETSSEDPLEMIENPLFGLKAKASKSGGLKKDGIGLVDSFRFIGIRYFPPKALLNKEDVIILGILSIILDLLAMPCPVFTVLSTGVCYRDGGLKTPERFEAETRKGAKLRFSSRESLLSYLLIARDGISSKYTGKTYKLNYSLRDWLRHNALKGIKIKGKSKLLGNNKYTGGFMARMFMDSGEISQYQNFNLTYRPDSGMGIVGPEYRIRHNLLGKSKISIFTASSFACHDLLRLIHDSRLKSKPRKFIKYIQISKE